MSREFPALGDASALTSLPSWAPARPPQLPAYGNGRVAETPLPLLDACPLRTRRATMEPTARWLTGGRKSEFQSAGVYIPDKRFPRGDRSKMLRFSKLSGHFIADRVIQPGAHSPAHVRHSHGSPANGSVFRNISERVVNFRCTSS